MKIYAISGLGADDRVFNYLDLNHPIEVLHWIDFFMIVDRAEEVSEFINQNTFEK